MTEVDALLDDLDRLAAAAPTDNPGAFYAQLLGAAALALGADAADHSPRHHGETPTRWPRDRRHGDALLEPRRVDRVAAEQTPRIVAAEADGAPVVACPVEGPSGVAGVLAFRLGVEAAGAAGRSLELATAVAEVASRYELRRATDRVAGAEERLALIEGVLVRLHAQRGLRAIAAEAADSGRRLVGCDRLAVLTRSGGAWRVVSVSGVNRVSRRSDAARRMQALVTTAMRWGDPLTAPRLTHGEATAADDEADRYRDATGVGVLKTLPCAAPDDAADPRVALLAEWFDADVHPSADALLGALARHVGVATQRERSALAPGAWLGRAATALVVLVALVALALWATFTPATLWVPVEGRFEPVRRARVFAPLDGVVEEVLVRQAERVKADQPLVRLASPELRLEQEEVAEAIASTRAEIAALETAELRAALPGRSEEADPTALASRLAALREKLGHQQERRDLLDSQAEKLLVASPLAGDVVSWRPEDFLADRPVRRGQRLLEIADARQWRLELEAPDHRSGHVLRAAAEGGALRVEYVVRSDPAATHTAAVDSIASATQAGDDGGPVVRVVATPDDVAAANPRSGLGVSAKIDCGEHSLGYVWLHEAIEAIRRRWF